MNDINTNNNLKITVQQSSSPEEWNIYANTNTSATIYHLHEWSKVLEDSFGYKPFHLFARNESGRLCGILPLFLVKSIIFGNRLVSLPFSYKCGPIADSDTVLVPLLREAKKLCDTLECRYLEIRMMSNLEHLNDNSQWIQNKFELSDQFSTFILDLDQPDLIWKNLDPSVRRAIRKAIKDGVVVRKGNGIKDLKYFYKLNLETKRNLGVPAHRLDFFSNTAKKLGELFTLYLAEFDGKTIAGILTMQYKDCVLYGYGGDEKKYRIHRPNNLLLWTAIEESCQKGYRFFDFGRTSPGEQGLILFKKHWGTEERVLSYYYYPHAPNSMALNDTGMKYKLATGLWKKMPLPLAQICSNIIFKHLG